MLSVEEMRKALNDDTLSDKEVEKIRDEMRTLVEIIFDKWLEERRSKKLYAKK